MDNLSYKRITQKEAKDLMEKLSDCIILDVRTREEFATSHIRGAINIPNEIIGHEDIEILLEDKEQNILVYCRSGHRSLQACSKLALLGYKNIYEFGGIITWEYEIEK